MTSKPAINLGVIFDEASQYYDVYVLFWGKRRFVGQSKSKQEASALFEKADTARSSNEEGFEKEKDRWRALRKRKRNRSPTRLAEKRRSKLLRKPKKKVIPNTNRRTSLFSFKALQLQRASSQMQRTTSQQSGVSQHSAFSLSSKTKPSLENDTFDEWFIAAGDQEKHQSLTSKDALWKYNLRKLTDEVIRYAANYSRSGKPPKMVLTDPVPALIDQLLQVPCDSILPVWEVLRFLLDKRSQESKTKRFREALKEDLATALRIADLDKSLRTQVRR